MVSTTRETEFVILAIVLLIPFFFGYGAIVDETLLGIETTSLAEWTFGAFFVAFAGLHLRDGQRSLAFGYGSATVGWLVVLLGSTTVHVTIGAVVLVLAGCYIAINTTRLQRAAESATA